MKSLKEFTELFKKHHLTPEIKEEKRYKGILQYVAACFLFGVFTIFLEYITPSFQHQTAVKSVGEMSVNLTILCIGMFVYFFPLCMRKGIKFLKPKEFTLLYSRAIVAIAGMWCYALSAKWTSTIDNSLLYGTDAIFVLLILKYLGVEIGKLSNWGIVIGGMGIVFVYLYDYKSGHELLGGPLRARFGYIFRNYYCHDSLSGKGGSTDKDWFTSGLCRNCVRSACDYESWDYSGVGFPKLATYASIRSFWYNAGYYITLHVACIFLHRSLPPRSIDLHYTNIRNLVQLDSKTGTLSHIHTCRNINYKLRGRYGRTGRVSSSPKFNVG